MAGRLEGKVALITGAGSGLGRECALLFAAEGAAVAVTDIVPARVEAVTAEVGAAGGRAIGRVADVRHADELAAAVAATEDELGGHDIEHANAGVPDRGFGATAFEDLTEDDYDLVIDTNLKGVILTVRHALPALKRRGGGSVVVTSSASAFAAYPGFPVYGASKAGVNGLVRSLALELGRFGIRVNGLAPTHGMSVNFPLPLDAPVRGQSYEEARGDWDPKVAPMPLHIDRPPSLADNARLALFLASDDAAYMSGVVVPATDGGTLARISINFEAGWQEREGGV